MGVVPARPCGDATDGCGNEGSGSVGARDVYRKALLKAIQIMLICSEGLPSCIRINWMRLLRIKIFFGWIVRCEIINNSADKS